MKTPPGQRFILRRVIGATAILTFLAIAFAVLNRHGSAVRTDDPMSAAGTASSGPLVPSASLSVPAPAGLMSAADRAANPATAAASEAALTEPAAAGGLASASRQIAAAGTPNSFALDSSAISLPWNGLKANAAGGSIDAGFGNRQLTATPAPVGAVSIEPVAGGDRTEGPVNDPSP